MENLATNLRQRTQILAQNNDITGGKSVIYVMSRDQRIHDNHALLAAQQKAIELGLPLAIVFVLYVVETGRAREHYDFMLGGLTNMEKALKGYNIPLVMLVGEPYERLMATFKHFKPAYVYFDFSSLRGPRALQTNIAKSYNVATVDTHNIVPVWHTSDKQEFAARTIRPKITKQLQYYLKQPAKLAVHPYPWPSSGLLDISQLQERISLELKDPKNNGTSIGFDSGEQAAIKQLNRFIHQRLRGYSVNRNDPSKAGSSGLSPYLHFGQISSLRVVLELDSVLNADGSLQADVDTIAEEIIVRKELSDNFCYYNGSYDSMAGAPSWAINTLQKHAGDPRPYIYNLDELCTANTHDPAWNAAQRQLMCTGLMHGYMRMYWAKKVLEWSSSPDVAHKNLVYINDFYSLDGGDPNGYVGILWSVAGLHDRPWGERPIYGTVRSMVYDGLKRKFDIQKYIDYNK